MFGQSGLRIILIIWIKVLARTVCEILVVLKFSMWAKQALVLWPPPLAPWPSGLWKSHGLSGLWKGEWNLSQKPLQSSCSAAGKWSFTSTRLLRRFIRQLQRGRWGGRHNVEREQKKTPWLSRLIISCCEGCKCGVCVCVDLFGGRGSVSWPRHLCPAGQRQVDAHKTV